ncbi:MAG: enoyl-CoA hydratase/isomerase family protein [Bacteroidales bacterium]|nr:enoyl-CoA hydratase/isomerase family protein [Bacteroidales bacterium]
MSNPLVNTIKWNVIDRIGHLVLTNSPSNKMSVEFFREMGLVKELILQLPDLKAIIISSEGRHFSSGVDLDELLHEISGHQDATIFLQSNYNTLSFLETLPFPVISVITGVCLGSALEMALFCHYRFCSEEAVLGLPETTFNLIPGIGGIPRFAALSGKARALEYILTGRTFDASKALELGIIDAIWPKKEMMERTTEFAGKLPEIYKKEMRKVYIDRYVGRKREGRKEEGRG